MSGEWPDDRVEGPDPAFDRIAETILAYRLTCKCGWSILCEFPTSNEMENHSRWAHPAYRNPELGCHAAPVFDHDRWCVRPKNHEGDHWTPSVGGGFRWANTARTGR